MRLKHIGQGIGISLFGASLWLFLYLHSMYERSDRFIVVTFCTLFGLLMSSVYVVPLGIVLGVVVPYFGAYGSRIVFLLAVTLIGITVAGVSSGLVAALFELNLASVFRSMLPLCVTLILGWALLVRRSLPAQSVTS